mmetsp:Transcript_28952/g.69156  ORF Transcript_28952/g.69156 Transcript_28952/m.69156 type:complete len:203 (+) Transcript_28952:1216-1824(+)
MGCHPHRHGLGGDDAGVAEGAEVHPKLVRVVCPEELLVNLGDAVHGARLLDGGVGGAVPRRGGPEHGNGARGEDLEAVRRRDVEHVLNSICVDSQCKLWISLPNGGKYRRKMNYCCDFVLKYKSCKAVFVLHVTVDACAVAGRFTGTNIARDNAFTPEPTHQSRNRQNVFPRCHGFQDYKANAACKCPYESKMPYRHFSQST